MKAKKLSKLHEKIIQDYGSVARFSRAHDLDSKRLNKQLLGVIRMKENDIFVISQILEIPKEEIVDFFMPDFLRGKIQHKGRLL